MRSRWTRRVLVGIALLIALIITAIGAFPVGLLRGIAERRLSAAYGAPVHVGAITRNGLFSFTPEIAVRDVRIGQPAWAGGGDFLRLRSASTRVPVFPLLLGRLEPQAVRVSGLDVALVRRADGTSNWTGQTRSDDGASPRPRIESLVIEDSRFSLRDARRRLDIAGTVAADDRTGVTLRAAGRFDGTPAQVVATGGRILTDAGSAWPITAQITSPALTASANGTMAGPLNARDMRLSVRARAPSLKELDYLIEAGLFGSQPIDLSAKVRHLGRDWFVDTMAGSIGRSRLTGRASVLKRDGRTKIDATLNASQFDFDDLADDAGLAEAAALKARIGPRVIPPTRVNLSKMGPTDGVIRFSAAQLLFKHPSVLRSAHGVLRLDDRLLRIEDLVATMDSGRITGSLRVDSRGRVPLLSTELRVEGVSLDRMIGDPATISGSARGVIRMTGRGDTIREAFAHGNGKIAFVATGGSVKKSVAFVLGQDLGGALGQAVGHALGGSDARVPLRCAILAFDARGGVLTPAPLAIDTGVSDGRGTGRIVLDGESVALTLTGSSKGGAVLKLADPIRVGGTLSEPRISVAGGSGGTGSGLPKKPSVIKILGKSIGSALGLRRDPPQPAPPPRQALDCPALTARALR